MTARPDDDAAWLGFRWLARRLACDGEYDGPQWATVEVLAGPPALVGGDGLPVVGGVVVGDDGLPTLGALSATSASLVSLVLMAFREESRWEAGLQTRGFEGASLRVLVRNGEARCEAVVTMAGLGPLGLVVDSPSTGVGPWKSNRGLHYSGLWPAVCAEYDRARARGGRSDSVSTVMGPCSPRAVKARWGRLFDHKWKV